MINYILVIFATITIYEFLRYVNFLKIIKRNLNIYKKFLKLFRSKNVSNNRKEQANFFYSKILLITSLKILLNLIIILSFILTLSFLSKSFINFFISFYGISVSSMTIIFYLQLKKHNAKL